MILPDRIPDLLKNDSCNNQSEYCVFVCSYAIDEPVSEMIEAGLLLNDVMPVYITGRIPRAMRFLKNQPYKNITFTDFISSEKYQSLINGAAVIVALTTEEDCLQCAGYEALSLNRPLVVSSTRALRDYFKDSAVYTSSKPKDICNAVIEAQKSSVRLRGNERELKEIRENSSRPQLAEIPHLFAQITQPANKDFILIPSATSENRDYIPMGFFNAENKSNNSCFVIATDDTSHFGVLTSRMHMVWMRAVGGRLKTDYRYSKNVIYNTFPFPKISEIQKEEITELVFNILDEREQHSEKTLAQLYDPDKMPQDLKEAHHQLDLAIEKCYRNKPFENDEERLEYLFKLYEEMIAKENSK